MLAFFRWARRWWKGIPFWRSEDIPHRRPYHHYRFRWLTFVVFWVEDHIFTVVALFQLFMRFVYMGSLFYYSNKWYGPYFYLDIRFYMLFLFIMSRYAHNTYKRMIWDTKGFNLRTTYKYKPADDFMGYLWDNRPEVMWYLVRVFLFLIVVGITVAIKIIFGNEVFFMPIFYFYVFLILWTIRIFERLLYAEYWIFKDFWGLSPIPVASRKIFKLLIFNYYLKTNNKILFKYKGPAIDPYHTPVEWYIAIWKDRSYDSLKKRYYSIRDELALHLSRGAQTRKMCNCAINFTRSINKYMRMMGYRAIYYFIFMYNVLWPADYKFPKINRATSSIYFAAQPVILFLQICLKGFIIVIFYFFKDIFLFTSRRWEVFLLPIRRIRYKDQICPRDCGCLRYRTWFNVKKRMNDCMS